MKIFTSKKTLKRQGNSIKQYKLFRKLFEFLTFPKWKDVKRMALKFSLKKFSMKKGKEYPFHRKLEQVTQVPY